MIKISLRLVRATQDGMVLAQRAVRTYVRYAYYSFRDRRGRQSDDSKSVAVDGPRHSLMYNNVEDFFLSQVSESQKEKLMLYSHVDACLVHTETT